jgi:uncharacterized membrane protein (DUF2068 family)
MQGMANSETARSDLVLRLIAAERAFRAVVLFVVGIALLTHPHTDWAAEVTRFAEHLGLNPNSDWIHRLINDIRHISATEDVVFGTIAVGYAVLEGTEAYGLWRRRRWAEWLTVIATSLLLIPELWALTKSITPLKLGGLIVNLLVVAYLLRRLRRTRSPDGPTGEDEAPAAAAQRA